MLHTQLLENSPSRLNCWKYRCREMKQPLCISIRQKTMLMPWVILVNPSKKKILSCWWLLVFETITMGWNQPFLLDRGKLPSLSYMDLFRIITTCWNSPFLLSHHHKPLPQPLLERLTQLGLYHRIQSKYFFMGHTIVAVLVTFHLIALTGIQLPSEQWNNPLLIMLIIALRHHHGFLTVALLVM